MDRKICCIILEILSIIIILLALITPLIIFFKIDLSSKLEIISIFLVIIVFYTGWRINRNEHRINQIGLVETLLIELEKIEEHCDWYENLTRENILPEHEIRDLKLSDYLTPIDSKIRGLKTGKIKKTLVNFQDKITLINNYSKWIMNLYLKPEFIEGKKDSKDMIKIYLDKLKKTLPDLRKELSKVKKECYRIIFSSFVFS